MCRILYALASNTNCSREIKPNLLCATARPRHVENRQLFLSQCCCWCVDCRSLCAFLTVDFASMHFCTLLFLICLCVVLFYFVYIFFLFWICGICRKNNGRVFLLASSRTDANRHQIMEMIAVNKIKQ